MKASDGGSGRREAKREAGARFRGSLSPAECGEGSLRAAPAGHCSPSSLLALSPRCCHGRDKESFALSCPSRSLLLGGLATSPGRLGWRPSSPRLHSPLAPPSEQPLGCRRWVAGGRLGAAVRGPPPRGAGSGGGGYKNEERIPGQRKGAVSCNPIPLRSRTPGQQSAWAWDSVPAGSPQGPGSCQGFPDLHLTVSPRPPRWGTGSQLGAAAPTVPLVVRTCEPG